MPRALPLAAPTSPPTAVPVSWEVGMSERADGGPYEVRLTFSDKQAVREWAVWLAALPTLSADGKPR